VHTGMAFDIFNRHADKNCHGECGADGQIAFIPCSWRREINLLRTPVYHVFDMYRPHMGAQAGAGQQSASGSHRSGAGGSGTLAGVVYFCIHSRQTSRVTLTNPSLDNALSVRIRLANGARASETRGTILTSPRYARHQHFCRSQPGSASGASS